MKTRTAFSLIATIALLGSSLAEEAATEIEVQPIQNPASRKAIININVNGKTETREIELEDSAASGTPITLASNAEPAKPVTPVMKTWLGVAADELPQEVRAQITIAEGVGLLIRNVVPESPAAAAGLVKNDVLVKLNDQLLINMGQLAALISSRKEGEVVRLTYLRRGSESVAEAKLTKHEEPALSSSADRFRVLFSDEWANTADKDGNFTTFDPPPVSFSRAMIMDKDGKIVSMPRLKNLEAAMAKVEKALRDAGVDEKAVEETRKSLQKTADEVMKSMEDLKEGNKVEVEKVIRESARALEHAILAVKPEPGADAGKTSPESDKPATALPAAAADEKTK